MGNEDEGGVVVGIEKRKRNGRGRKSGRGGGGGKKKIGRNVNVIKRHKTM